MHFIFQIRQRLPEEVPVVYDTIREWLDSLGLPDYVDHFEQNEIYCPLGALSLTKHDLQYMGIYMLGHRKKILVKLSKLQKSLLSST